MTPTKYIVSYLFSSLLPGISRPIENFRFGKKALTEEDASGLPGLRRQVERLRELLTQARAEMQIIPEKLDMSDGSSDESSKTTETDSITSKPARINPRRKDSNASSKRDCTSLAATKAIENDSDLESESDLASLSKQSRKSTSRPKKPTSKRQHADTSSTALKKKTCDDFELDSDSDLSSMKLPSSSKRKSTSSAKQRALLEDSDDSDSSLLKPVFAKLGSRTHNRKDDTPGRLADESDFESSDGESTAVSSTKRSRANRWGVPLYHTKSSTLLSSTEGRQSNGLSFSKCNAQDKPAKEPKSRWLSTSRRGTASKPLAKPKTSPWSAARADSPPAAKQLPVPRTGRSIGARKEPSRRRLSSRTKQAAGSDRKPSPASGSASKQKRKILESPDAFSGRDQEPLSSADGHLLSKGIDLTNSSDSSDDGLPSHLHKEDARKNVRKSIKKLVSKNKALHPSPPDSKKENKAKNRTPSQRTIRPSVFRPTELESDDHQQYGCFDSSDDENCPQRKNNGLATKIPSASKEDRGYSSISSATTSIQSSVEPKKASKKKTPKAQGRQSTSSTGSKACFASTSYGSMQLSFQPVPRSGSRFD